MAPALGEPYLARLGQFASLIACSVFAPRAKGSIACLRA